ncbi:hypothetical protein D038_2994B, partial [Vibrio parahaemolyticus IDH02189]
HPPADVSI